MAALPARRTLADVVASPDLLGPASRTGTGRTIFAEQPWGPDSRAVVLAEDALRGRAPSMPTYACLLEVGRAAEVLEVWSNRRGGAVPSPQEAAEALIHYASHEAHQPMTCQQHGCGRPEAATCSSCGRSVCGTHTTGPTTVVRCPPCSRSSAADATRSTAASTAVRALAGPCSAVLVVGALTLTIGVLVRSMPLGAVGTCLLVVATCIWLGRFVLHSME